MAGAACLFPRADPRNLHATHSRHGLQISSLTPIYRFSADFYVVILDEDHQTGKAAVRVFFFEGKADRPKIFGVEVFEHKVNYSTVAQGFL